MLPHCTFRRRYLPTSRGMKALALALDGLAGWQAGRRARTTSGHGSTERRADLPQSAKTRMTFRCFYFGRRPTGPHAPANSSCGTAIWLACIPRSAQSQDANDELLQTAMCRHLFALHLPNSDSIHLPPATCHRGDDGPAQGTMVHHGEHGARLAACTVTFSISRNHGRIFHTCRRP